MDFSVNPVGIDFRMFDTPHLVALALVALANLSLLALRQTPRATLRRIVRLGLAAAILASFASYSIWRMWTGLWNVREDLPLHICDVMALVTAWHLIAPQAALANFVYFIGIAGATQALLTSDAGIYGYPHLFFISSMVLHGAIVTAGVHCAVVEGFRPTRRSLWRAITWTTAYAAIIFCVNLTVGSNYLFIGHKPQFPSLIDRLGPWPWYALALVAIGAALVHLLYLPFAWRARRERMNG